MMALADVTLLWVCLGLAGFFVLWALVRVACLHPRIGLYLILAFSPTQYIFIPVGDFFLSPADSLVLAAGAGVVLRAAVNYPETRFAIRQHLAVGLMLAMYVVGFLILDHFSRTIVRIVMAVVPSILACELLRTRHHLAMAGFALIGAGVVDASFGLYFMAIGEPLHPTRFSGMMGVNFSAIAILTAAVVASAYAARSRDPIALALAATLSLAGLATLSRMGFLLLGAAWTLILWRLLSPGHRRLATAAAVVLLVLPLAHQGIGERVAQRWLAEVQADGVARSSDDVRTLILRRAWDALAVSPVWGVGYGNFVQYRGHDPDVLASPLTLTDGTHNTYLEVLVEGGVLAFAAFLCHFMGYSRGLRAAWIAVSVRQDVIVGGLLAGALMAMMSAAFANVLLHYHFWGACGVGLATIHWLRRDSEARIRPQAVESTAV